MTSIPFSSIIEGDRARSKKNYGDIGPLAESIKTLGTIQPIVLSKRTPDNWPNGESIQGNEVFDLVAGGRRYQALKKLKVTELFHGSTLNPEKPGFVFADEVAEHTRKEAELDENLHRLEMDWIDSALLVADIHEAKRLNAHATGRRWGERQTAALLGKGYGKSNVNNAIRAAEVLRGRAGPEKQKEMTTTCSGLSDTVALFCKWKEDEALAELQKRNSARIAKQVSSTPQGNTGATGMSSFLDTFTISQGTTKGPVASALEMLNNNDPGAQMQSKLVHLSSSTVATEKVEVPLSRMFFCNDFRVTMNRDTYPNLKEFGFGQVDHIVTDIPYGIDMDNLDEKQVADVKDQHDVAQNVGMMETFLRLAYDAIKPGGFCVFAYDLDHHEKLQTWAKAAGFRVQRWPVIAGKTSACQNNAAQYNTTKDYECVMYLRKDEKTVLRRPSAHSVRIYDFAAERRLYNNPFAKPFAFWKDIYDDIAFPGQSVLDPFAGEMSACRAAANCGLIPYGIEISEQHFNRGIAHMQSVYALIHKSNCLFT